MKPKIFEHTFSNKTRIEVTEGGFTVWDEDCRKIIIDASTVVEDNLLNIKTKRRSANAHVYSGKFVKQYVESDYREIGRTTPVRKGAEKRWIK